MRYPGAMDAPQAEARCALHPEQSAARTCARCGSFMCDACRASELPAHCAACAHRIAEGRFVNHVPMLGIAMMVNGALTAGMGLYYFVFGGFFAAELSRTPGVEGPDDDLFAGVMFGALGLIAFVHLVPGALQLWAGWRARTFRSRPLAFVALALGLVTVLGCYCAPSSLGLLVWGVIVLVHEDVRERFAAAEAAAT